MIYAKASAPDLCPKTKPEDQQKLKEFYRFVDERLAGMEDAMKKVGIEKLTIEIGPGRPENK